MWRASAGRGRPRLFNSSEHTSNPIKFLKPQIFCFAQKFWRTKTKREPRNFQP